MALTPKDYKNAISGVTELHLSGGILYDALHIEAAIKCGAKKLITLNHEHFEKLSIDRINTRLTLRNINF